MTVIRVKGVKRYRDRHGKWRCYHRKTGVAIKAEYGSGEFFVELSSLNATVAAKAAPKAGTLGGLIAAYRLSPRFETRATRTRSDYQNVFEYLGPLADDPLSRFDSALVVGIQERHGAPRAVVSRTMWWQSYPLSSIGVSRDVGRNKSSGTHRRCSET